MSQSAESRRTPASKARHPAKNARHRRKSGTSGTKAGEPLADDRLLAERDALLSIAEEGALLADPQGRIIFSNEPCRRLLGLTADGEPLTLAHVAQRLARPDGTPLGQETWAGARALRGETVRGEIAVAMREGLTSWLSINAGPVPYKDGQGAAITLNDVTALQTLEQHNDQMIRLVSHDIRNPLTSIQLNAQLMDQTVSQRGLEREKRFAEMILSAARKLDGLIQELVDSARVRSGRLRLDLRPVVIEQLVPEVLARNSRVLDTSRIRLALPKERTTAIADLARLERVIVNLLTIAFQHAADASEIGLRVLVNGTDVHFTIVAPGRRTDRGASMASQHGHLQSDHGFGLGLYIARVLVERHGGRLWVENPSGPETLFHFAIPMAGPGASVGRT